MKKRILSILFALLIIVAIPVFSHAEFGEFAGDSDYGYDSGGYDSGGYDSGNDYDYDDDDDDRDYNYADNKKEHTTLYYSFVSGSHSNDDSFGGHYDSNGKQLVINNIKNEDDTEANYSAILGAILLGAIIIIVVAVRRSKRATPSYHYQPAKPVINPGAEQTPTGSLVSMDRYTSIDPEFSETELKEKISNIYIQMQNCWQNKNLEQLRPYFTDSLYAMYDRQLEPYKKNHQTNKVERIAVLGVVLSGWRKHGDNDEIIATVRTRIVDYVVDDNTQQVIRGDKNKEKFMTYEWTLSRKSGVKTTSESGTRVINCPNCGAPIDINKSAKCEYCGSIVTVDSSDWLISEIKGIAQRTAK